MEIHKFHQACWALRPRILGHIRAPFTIISVLDGAWNPTNVKLFKFMAKLINLKSSWRYVIEGLHEYMQLDSLVLFLGDTY